MFFLMNYALALSLLVLWFCFKAKLNQSKAKSDIPKSQNEENKILTLFTTRQAVKILQNLLSNG